MITVEITTDHPAIYRATVNLWQAICDESLPDSVRASLIADVASEVLNIVAQLDFSKREVITQLYPLVLELGRTARLVGEAPTEHTSADNPARERLDT